jgi:hypothetical protein
MNAVALHEWYKRPILNIDAEGDADDPLFLLGNAVCVTLFYDGEGAECQEGGKQEAEGRRQKAEGRRQKAEGRRQKAEGRRQKAEGRNKKWFQVTH